MTNNDIDLTDARELLSKISDANFSTKQNNRLIESLQKAAFKQGERMILKAVNERVLSKAEVMYYEHLGLSVADLGTVLLSYFNVQKDGKEFVIMTLKNSPININKTILQDRFKIKIITPEELISDVQKKDPVQFKRIVDKVLNDANSS